MWSFNAQLLCHATAQSTQGVTWKTTRGISIQHEQQRLSPVEARHTGTLNCRKTAVFSQLCARCYIKDKDSAISGYTFQDNRTEVRLWQRPHYPVNDPRSSG